MWQHKWKTLQSKFQTSLHHINFTYCHDFVPARKVTLLMGQFRFIFSLLGVSELSQMKKICIPPFDSQLVTAGSKHLALNMIKGITMGEGNIYKSWEL